MGIRENRCSPPTQNKARDRLFDVTTTNKLKIGLVSVSNCSVRTGRANKVPGALDRETGPRTNLRIPPHMGPKEGRHRIHGAFSRSGPAEGFTAGDTDYQGATLETINGRAGLLGI